MGRGFQLASSWISLCLASKVCSTLLFETRSLSDVGTQRFGYTGGLHSLLSDLESQAQDAVPVSLCGCWGSKLRSFTVNPFPLKHLLGPKNNFYKCTLVIEQTEEMLFLLPCFLVFLFKTCFFCFS